MAGRAGGTLVLRPIASAEPSLHDVIGNCGPDRTAGEPESAEVATPFEHEGPDGTRVCDRRPVYTVLALQLPAVQLDRLVQRRAHRNGGALRKARGDVVSPPELGRTSGG